MFMVEQNTKHNKEYSYNVGDVVNGLVISEQCCLNDKAGHKRKAYKYTCTTCGYDCGEYYKNGVHHKEHMIAENNLSHGAGCAVCSRNGLVVPSINSIHALQPEIEIFLKNKDDAFKYAPSSAQKLECVCPDCGKEYIRSCAKISNYGVPCVCGDGFSYPEKFIFKALQQLKVNFKPQYYLEGSMFRYDFYLMDFNIIIEVNGIQHYKQKWERNEVENDARKKDFAFSCGFTDDNYIVLDCRESKSSFIKSSLLSSKLSERFDFSAINFEECSKFASGNMVKIACNLWNAGDQIQEIAQKMKLDKHTIIAYLKQGDDCCWCVYKPGDGIKRRPNLAMNLRQKDIQEFSEEDVKNKNKRKRIYNSWSNMMRRCYDTNNEKYSRYGARGINVCDEWDDFESFFNWALKNGYQDSLVLGRININQDYYPENCRWVTKNELSNNKSTNHFITFNGETHTLQEWSRITGLDRRIISKRIDQYGWSVEDALMKPVKQQKDKDELLINFDGEEHTLSEWSRILDIKRETLKSRLYNGWSVEKAFTHNVQQKK